MIWRTDDHENFVHLLTRIPPSGEVQLVYHAADTSRSATFFQIMFFLEIQLETF